MIFCYAMMIFCYAMIMVIRFLDAENKLLLGECSFFYESTIVILSKIRFFFED